MRASVPVSVTAVLAAGVLATLPAGAPLAPAAADAAAFRPRAIPAVGEKRPQIAVRAGRRIGLTAKAARAYRRGRIALTCRSEERREGSIGVLVSESNVTSALEPRVRLDLPRDAETCTVAVQVRKGNSRTGRPIGQVAMTAAGLERLRRQNTVTAMMLYLPFVAGQETGLTEQQRAEVARSVYVFGSRVPVVALAAPDGPVPAGGLGWFLQDRRFVAVATLPDGRRLFYDHDAATDITTTNVLEDLSSVGDDEPDW